MQITFLGTSGMVPTKERNVAGVFLSYKDDGILFDCGEGTQRQMNIAGIKRNAVTKILISHWHGDHVAGIIGLIQTLGNEKDEINIEIYGPKDTKKYMEHVLKSCIFELKINIKIFEIEAEKPKRFFENEYFALEAAEMDHSVPCLGFSFVEKDRRNINKDFLIKNNIPEGQHLKELLAGNDISFKGKKIAFVDAVKVANGRKVTYVMDTMYCSNAIELANDADLLICESVYSSNLQDKAEEFKHMTSKSAAMVANQANVRQLVLTHFSQRYKNTQEIEEDARTYFDNVLCAVDFMKIDL